MMSYEMLEKASLGCLLPLIMEMNNLNPKFIDNFIVEPIINYKVDVTSDNSKDDVINSENNNVITPEHTFIKLIMKSNIEDKPIVEYIYNKLIEKKYIISDKFLLELLNNSTITNFDIIFKDNIDRLADILEKRYNISYQSYKGTLYFIDKDSLDFAEHYFLKMNDNIDSVLEKATLKHLSGIAKLMYDIDSTTPESENYLNIYKKLIDNNFKDGNFEKKYTNTYGINKINSLYNVKETYENLMKLNMPEMSEDLLSKSLILGFQDSDVFENNMPILLKKLKITKSSLDYANLVANSLDIKTNLKFFKKDFYSFNKSFWEEKNLLGTIDNDGLSRGMKILLDMDMNQDNWDAKSIPKVKEIFKTNIEPHINAIYKDYLDRRCFELLNAQYCTLNAISKNTYRTLYCMENNNLSANFIKNYINIKDENNINLEQYNRIKNVVDFYTCKVKKDKIFYTKGIYYKEYITVVNVNRYPEDVFKVLNNYQDIVLDILKNNNSTLDNNLVLYALASDLISENDLNKAQYKLTSKSVNELTIKDLENSSFKNKKQPSSELIIKSLFHYFKTEHDIFPKINILLEKLNLEELIPQVGNITKKVSKF